MRTVKIILLSLYVLVSAIAVSADVRLPALISDNMVLQQQMNVPVWGWAAPGESVTVTGSWDGSNVSTKADPDGRWQVKVKTPKASGPYTLTIKGQNTVRLDNVLIGEVWICSGQSNMEMPVMGNWAHLNNARTEAKNADYP
ncbi:MAG: carboxypeptidase-like regulatory domain-containing protein, partial [Sedimentisphaerales bacterium]|nr:carboxypeptidase-like regulatory domain-containing protein [Sedimentisphaerales bacterium]